MSWKDCVTGEVIPRNEEHVWWRCTLFTNKTVEHNRERLHSANTFTSKGYVQQTAHRPLPDLSCRSSDIPSSYSVAEASSLVSMSANSLLSRSRPCSLASTPCSAVSCPALPWTSAKNTSRLHTIKAPLGHIVRTARMTMDVLTACKKFDMIDNVDRHMEKYN